MATRHDIPDRRDRLFGREGDLDALAARVRHKGLTAVTARPFMGKSWTLTELARRLDQDDGGAGVLVGRAESSGETPDLLLRAVVNLYARWLSDAEFLAQAQMSWEQQRSKLLPGVVGAVGRICKELGGAAAKPVLAVVEEAIKGLTEANKTLTTGGAQLPALQYDQARDLVAAVAGISGRRIVLILDQWEKSPDPAFEAKALGNFLDHLDDWPQCHLFVALRPDDPAHEIMARVVAGRPGAAQLYSLEQMALGEGQERERLAAFIRQKIPGAGDTDSDALLKLIDGYPGVIYQWSSDYQLEHMRSLDDLESVAQDAQTYRFSELETLLPALAEGPLQMAVRLALLPLGGSGSWPEIKGEVLGRLCKASRACRPLA